ncbi:MAG: LysE family transporter [Bacteroidales bacterium]|nr:LysE family transporter [Bacteroidales bacterium]
MLVGFGFSSVIEKFPEIFVYVKYIGSGFIILLAIKFFKMYDIDNDKINNVPGFLEGILLNALNPKAIMALAVMYSQFLDQDQSRTRQVLVMTLLTFLVSVSAHFLWTTGGNWLRIKCSSAMARNVQKYVFSIMMVAVSIVLLII